MTRRATRNAQQTIYRLYFRPLERNHLVLRGGGGLTSFVWTDNLFSAWARREISVHVAWTRENLFSCITTVHCTEAIITRTVILLKAIVHE